MSFAVVGTDTDVGKTFVSALLLHKLQTRYLKLVATGHPELDDTAEVRRLTADRWPLLAESATFELPASPHLAARRERRRLTPSALVRRLQSLPRGTIVEGAGGALVPFTMKGVTFADLVAQAGLPVVVVARGSLGTINHTLMTLEVLRSRGIEVSAVIVNGEDPLENVADIRRFGGVPVFGPLPRLRRPSARAVGRLLPRLDGFEVTPGIS